MRTLSIPFFVKNNDKTREDYLQELKRAKADRVFLCTGSAIISEEELKQVIVSMKENVAYFKQAGYTVGIWMNGFGHGGDLIGPYRALSADYTKLTGLHGETAGDSFCPSDPQYMKAVIRLVSSLASCSPDLIMIDDDLRICMHGAAKVCCTCDNHLAMISQKLGRTVTREEIAANLYTGKPNELRKAFRAVMGDTMRTYAREVRQAVDEVNPDIRLGYCACLTTFDVDADINSLEITRIMAGKNRPFLRLIGAPYWGRSARVINLGNTIELERMEARWCRELAPDIEIFSEGDVYPRPRYVVPSAFLECFDEALLADGSNDGILKYMLDYCHKPLYETGYIDRHVFREGERRQITEAFGEGDCVGITLFQPMELIAEVDCTGYDESDVTEYISRPELRLCAASGIPTTYAFKPGRAVMVFGEKASKLPEQYKGAPLVLDVISAKLLGGMGIDTGLRKAVPAGGPATETFPDGESFNVPGRGIYLAEVDEKAEILSTFIRDGKEMPSVYRYENSTGQRFLVYCVDMTLEINVSDFLRSYNRSEQLYNAVTYLQAGTPLCAYVRRSPDVYLLCKETADKLVVGIWNCYPDMILPRDIPLASTYRSVSFLGSGKGELCGKTVRLTESIPPYGFAGLVLQK